LTDKINRLAPTKIHNLRAKYFFHDAGQSIIFVDLNNVIWVIDDGDIPAVEIFNPEKIPDLKVKSYVKSSEYDCWFMIDLNNNVWSFGNGNLV
jgi:hypothetical protein